MKRHAAVILPVKSLRTKALTLALSLLAGVGLLLALRQSGGNAERVREFGSRDGYPVTVLDGVIYYLAPDRLNLDVRSVPVRGGPHRQIYFQRFDGDRSPGFGEPLYDLIRISGDGIFFRTREPFRLRASLADSGQPLAPRPGVRLYEPLRPVRLWRVPLSGGLPEELSPKIRTHQVHVSRDTVYWVDSELKDLTRPIVKPESWKPRQELFAAPLSGGPPRKVARLPAVYGWLRVSSRGIYWRADADLQSWLLVGARAPDFLPRPINDYPYNYELPCETGNRLYWVDRAPGGYGESHQIVSTAPDGSDRRVELDVDPQRQGKTFISQLTDLGPSFCFLRHHYSGSARGGFREERALWRFPSDGPGKPQRLVRSLPQKSVQLLAEDEGYVYYLADDLRENWFDWSPRGLMARPVRQLFRIWIPD